MRKLKKLICFILCITTLLGSLSLSAFAAGAEENQVMPRYNNVGLTDSLFYIDADGLAYVIVAYDGYPGITTGATITIELQKLFLGVFWRTVDIGEPDNRWFRYLSGATNYAAHTHQLSSMGTYRAVIHYSIYGTAGPADEVEDLMTCTY